MLYYNKFCGFVLFIIYTINVYGKVSAPYYVYIFLEESTTSIIFVVYLSSKQYVSVLRNTPNKNSKPRYQMYNCNTKKKMFLKFTGVYSGLLCNIALSEKKFGKGYKIFQKIFSCRFLQKIVL